MIKIWRQFSFFWLIVCGVGCPSNTEPTPDSGITLVDAQVDSGPALVDAGVDPDAGETPSGDAGGCGGMGETCVDGERCSVYGRCFSGDCLVHEDCSADQRCNAGQCLNRPNPELGILFERVHGMAFADHLSRIPTGSESRSASAYGDFGFGAALFDMDGDKDLDLFIGSQGQGEEPDSTSCIYRNESLPSAPHFEPDDLFCAFKRPGVSGGFGTDLEGDGYHELIMTGFHTIRIQRFHPRLEIIELHELIPEGDERRSCNVGAAISMDFDLDGLIDIFVGCQFDDVNANGMNGYNLLFRQLAEGGFAFVDRPEWDREEPLLLAAWGSTLGLGAADLNGDGLLDLMVSEDEATRPQYLLPDPGGIYMSCSPIQNCRYRPIRAGYGNLEWGGYMGSAALHLSGQGTVVYFTDLGPNRAVALYARETPDFARFLRLELYDGLPTFSWGVFADDLNRDGRDDLLVAQGATKSNARREYAMHFDAVLLQTDVQRFSTHSDEIGLAPSSTEDSRHEDYSYATRAVLRTDLDFDGYIDLINTALEGVPRLQREVPIADGKPPRCNIIPIDRYVPGFGVGHSLLSPVDGVWRQWDSQGQLRSGTSPYLLSPWTSGTMRFPSGARADYDCAGRAGPVVVEEPEWLRLSRTFTQMIIEVDAAGPEGQLTVFFEPQRSLHPIAPIAEENGMRRFALPTPAGAETMMLRFGPWWVARRFAL